jgi:Uma2 family endonuclease
MFVTYRQFLTDTGIEAHTEWVDGQVQPMPLVSGIHQEIGGFLLTLTGTYVSHMALGQVLYRPFQMKTGPNLPGRAPDILFLAKANEKRLKKNHLEGPAELVVEIISPESRWRDRGEKFFEYEQGGVSEYWLIDPQRKQAEFYVRGKDGIFVLTAVDKNSVFHSKAIKGFWIKTSWLWQQPLPTEWSIIKQWKLG